MTEAAPGKEPEKTPSKGGRPKGSLNKLTVSAREAFQAAFEQVGGVEKLVEWALKNDGENLGDFFKLYARMIPTDVKLDLPQLGEGPVDLAAFARDLLFTLNLASRPSPSQPTQH